MQATNVITNLHTVNGALAHSLHWSAVRYFVVVTALQLDMHRPDTYTAGLHEFYPEILATASSFKS